MLMLMDQSTFHPLLQYWVRHSLPLLSNNMLETQFTTWIFQLLPVTAITIDHPALPYLFDLLPHLRTDLKIQVQWAPIQAKLISKYPARQAPFDGLIARQPAYLDPQRP